MQFSVMIIFALQAVTTATPAAFKKAIKAANEATHMTAAQILFKKRTEALSRKYAHMLESNLGFGISTIDKRNKEAAKGNQKPRNSRIVKRSASNDRATKHGKNGARSNRFRSFTRYHRN